MTTRKIYVLTVQKHEPNSKHYTRYFGSKDRRDKASKEVFTNNTLHVLDQQPTRNEVRVTAKDYTNMLWTITYADLTLE